MIRYTTPTITLEVPKDITSNTNVYVSLKQGNVQKDVKVAAANMTVSNGITTITVSLTQEDTAKFTAGTCTAQVNWITSEGKRDSTGQARIKIEDNLLDRVIAYG